MTSKSAQRGGNSLGLDPSPPLILLELAAIWALASDDTHVVQAIRSFIQAVDEAAERQGLASRYVYLNYAYAGQDPLRGYGRESRERLREVSRRYDPEGFFQTGVPGGFKLFG